MKKEELIRRFSSFFSVPASQELYTAPPEALPFLVSGEGCFHKEAFFPRRLKERELSFFEVIGTTISPGEGLKQGTAFLKELGYHSIFLTLFRGDFHSPRDRAGETLARDSGIPDERIFLVPREEAQRSFYKELFPRPCSPYCRPGCPCGRFLLLGTQGDDHLVFGIEPFLAREATSRDMESLIRDRLKGALALGEAGEKEELLARAAAQAFFYAAREEKPWREYLPPELTEVRHKGWAALEKEASAFDPRKGLEAFNRLLPNLKKSKRKIFPGRLALRMVREYGFTYELTEEMAALEGLITDKEGFEAGEKKGK